MCYIPQDAILRNASHFTRMTTSQTMLAAIAVEGLLALFFFVRWMVARAQLAAQRQLQSQQEQAQADAAAAQERRWQAELNALREEFRSSAGAILEERTAKLDGANQASMKVLVEPLKERLKDLQEALATSQKERAALKASVQQNLVSVQNSAARMASETATLTSALKGSSKLQGNWGELQLEQALVDCGLVPDVNFRLQAAIEGTDGHAIPDATVLFPDGRKLFIDSKISLVAYMRYAEASDEAGRKQALAEHLASVRSHVKGLAARNYPALANRSTPGCTPDFTILFMGNEGALMLALSADPTLWEHAFRTEHVLLASRMSLYPLLWLIKAAWRQEQRSSNQRDIMEKTALLIDRLDNFVEAFEKVGERLEGTRRTYDDAYRQLTESRQSVRRTGQNIAALMGKEAARLARLPAGDGGKAPQG